MDVFSLFCLKEGMAPEGGCNNDQHHFLSGLTSDFIVPPSPRRGGDSTDLGDMQMMLIFQEYTDLLPKVNDVNSMSKEMGKVYD